ncbi:hypothetical protein LOD50_09985 [Xylella fastidiosa subsp. multiplex]|uniref:Uncharacterized protein n=1 Tax=Xylella fastidiosa subsp. multiplex TaxID=644357 RepID=A0AAW6I1W3_XYLFS|nr:hypothetical protein [Xylella fastidiosa]MDC6409514.1 hypothetical protein [Xylella fastidiosa subsp. multiplex]MDC6409574.1 hypothetical protein [Xylella fastidiosa subsp. multiplex]MDD0936710.1 hypothetical protein [Xylella fastidiosa subsp. multiplex]MSS68127.1 hypothetical protein [Xylella fastidiosa subsp. multiplex]
MQNEKSGLSDEFILQLRKAGIYVKQENSKISFSIDPICDVNLGKSVIHDDLWRESLRKKGAGSYEQAFLQYP